MSGTWLGQQAAAAMLDDTDDLVVTRQQSSFSWARNLALNRKVAHELCWYQKEWPYKDPVSAKNECVLRKAYRDGVVPMAAEESDLDKFELFFRSRFFGGSSSWDTATRFLSISCIFRGPFRYRSCKVLYKRGSPTTWQKFPLGSETKTDVSRNKWYMGSTPTLY